jgi:hypothetical protein
MRFILKLNLGNAAMTSNNDVAHALIDIASRIMNNNYPVNQEMDRIIFDSNGNNCGSWCLTK